MSWLSLLILTSVSLLRTIITNIFHISISPAHRNRGTSSKHSTCSGAIRGVATRVDELKLTSPGQGNCYIHWSYCKHIFKGGKNASASILCTDFWEREIREKVKAKKPFFISRKSNFESRVRNISVDAKCENDNGKQVIKKYQTQCKLTPQKRGYQRSVGGLYETQTVKKK